MTPDVAAAAGPVLVLAGTAEARDLATRLDGHGFDVVASLAGRTSSPVPYPGRTRVGGFGGPAGLVRYLEAEGVSALVDATHPASATMPHNAYLAAAQAGVPRLRLLRPPWGPAVGDHWIRVADLDAAADAVRAGGWRRPFLAVGRWSLAPFDGLADAGVAPVIRSIDRPDGPSTGRTAIMGVPGDVAGDEALLHDHGVDVVVSKNSGGPRGRSKLDAARRMGLPVVLVERPSAPPGPLVATVDEAFVWVQGSVGRTIR